MRGELRIPLSTELGVDFPGARGGRYAIVRGGYGAVELAAKYGELGRGTVLTGEFILGKKVLYGRFKQAQTPGGKTYPVCMEFWERGGVVEIVATTGPDTAKVYSRAEVRPVDSFE
jgi:hypothetical protein